MGCELSFVKNDKDWDVLDKFMYTLWRVGHSEHTQIMKIIDQSGTRYAWQTSTTIMAF